MDASDTSSLWSLTAQTETWFILAAICGVLLLFGGSSVLRLGVFLTGLAMGTWLGWLAWTAWDLPVPAGLMMAVGGLVLACAGLFMARPFAAVMLGLVMMTLVFAVLQSVFSLIPNPQHTPLPTLVTQPVPSMIASFVTVHAVELESLHEDEDPGALLQAAITRTWTDLRDGWNSLPELWQKFFWISAASAALAGLLIGLFNPINGLEIMTSLWGGLLLMIAASGFINPESDTLINHPLATTLLWFGVSTVGWSIQVAITSSRNTVQT